jgi:hypothetical protein
MAQEVHLLVFLANTNVGFCCSYGLKKFHENAFPLTRHKVKVKKGKVIPVLN